MVQHRLVSPLFTALLFACFLFAGPASAQQSTDAGAGFEALQQEIQALKQGQLEILKRLQALETTVAQGSRRRQAKPFLGAEISIDGAPAKGSPDAKIAIIEFSDYQCPFCRRFSDRTLPLILENYVDNGTVKFFLLDFPIERIHSAAMPAAIAARCAGAQGKYWQMHDLLFQDQTSVVTQDWRGMAKVTSLDLAMFDLCMVEDSHSQAIRQSIAEGRRLGITGTPTFFLGAISDDGMTVKATEMVVGAKSYEYFKAIIDRLLN